MKAAGIIAVFALCSSTVVTATETITYSYDAKGRLVTVVHSGSVNNGVQTTYGHDAADNRTRVTLVGASH